MSTRSAIFRAIKRRLLNLSALHEDRVVIGRANPNRLPSEPGRPVVFVFWRSDFGRRSDGGMSERSIMIRVGVAMRIDRAKDEEQLLQLSDLYDTIHAEMEKIADDDCDKLLVNMIEEQPGIVPLGDNDDDALVYIESNWSGVYLRPTGQA